MAGIVVEPADDLLRLQRKLIDAVAPFTATSGTAAAFVSSKGGRDIQPALIEYVADFVPKSSGKNFNPHVTIGVATQDYLKQMLAEPFEAFTFSPVGVAVYHLGTFGTAHKKLGSWEFSEAVMPMRPATRPRRGYLLVFETAIDAISDNYRCKHSQKVAEAWGVRRDGFRTMSSS